MIVYPKPDRSAYTPSRTKTAEHPQVDIGWNEGVFRDGRPYRVELWAMDQVTSLTVFFSTAGLEQLTNEAARELLEHEGILTPAANTAYRSAYARLYVDGAGKPMWSVNTVIADDETVYADAPGPFHPYGASNVGPTTIAIGRDTTLRWSFRDGDYLVWVRVSPWTAEPSPEIVDFWELNNGQYATLTNRYQDLPAWFDLTPPEVANAAAHWMVERLNSGEAVPDEPVDGPNVWRVMAGDWLIWVGSPRNTDVDLRTGTLLANAKECVLVLGEGDLNEQTPIFGAPRRDGFPPDQLVAVRSGIAEIKARGFPRSLATEWAIG